MILVFTWKIHFTFTTYFLCNTCLRPAFGLDFLHFSPSIGLEFIPTLTFFSFIYFIISLTFCRTISIHFLPFLSSHPFELVINEQVILKRRKMCEKVWKRLWRVFTHSFCFTYLLIHFTLLYFHQSQDFLGCIAFQVLYSILSHSIMYI